MTDKHELRLVLGLSDAGLAGFEAQVAQLETESDQRGADIWDACYRLACGGYDAPAIHTALDDIVQFADEFRLWAGVVADRAVTVDNCFDCGPDELGGVLESIGDTVLDHPTTTRDVFATLERAGPVAVHNDYTVGDVLQVIGEESRQAPPDGTVSKRVTDRLYEEALSDG